MAGPVLGGGTSSNNDHQQKSSWHSDDIIIVVVLPIILAILFGLSLRHCYVSNRRHAAFHEQRQNVRALERAQVREEKRLREKRRRERLREIERALISKVRGLCSAICIGPPCSLLDILTN